MSCVHCDIKNSPSIRELRRDSFKEANNLLREANIPHDDSPAYTFDDVMTLACYLIGLGEEDDG